MPANVNVNVNLIPNTKQVDVAFDSISKRASSVKFGQPLGRISGDVTEFRKSLEAATARVTAFGLKRYTLSTVLYLRLKRQKKKPHR